MANEPEAKHSALILDEGIDISLAELCRASMLSAEQVLEYVEQGIIEPRGRKPTHWRFSGISIRRVRSAYRLQQDLGVNTAGVALALDLIEELEILRERLRRLEE